MLYGHLISRMMLVYPYLKIYLKITEYVNTFNR